MIIFQNSCLMPKKLGRMELQWAITGVGQIFESQLYITDPWPTGISDVALSFRRLFALAKYHTLTPCLFFLWRTDPRRQHIKMAYQKVLWMHNFHDAQPDSEDSWRFLVTLQRGVYMPSAYTSGMCRVPSPQPKKMQQWTGHRMLCWGSWRFGSSLIQLYWIL